MPDNLPPFYTALEDFHVYALLLLVQDGYLTNNTWWPAV